MTIAKLFGVSKSFGSAVVFSDISFELEEGTIYALVGANGSGKSLLMKMICRFELPTSGDVEIDPRYLANDKSFPQHFGVAINGPAYLPNLTGEANLLRLARIRKEVGIERVREVLDEVGLPRTRKRVSSYSMGMKQKLSLAQALLEHPKVLVLDEPFNALDEASVERGVSLLKKFHSNGGTVLFSSHQPSEVIELAQRVLVISNHGVIEQPIEEYAASVTARPFGPKAT